MSGLANGVTDDFSTTIIEKMEAEEHREAGELLLRLKQGAAGWCWQGSFISGCLWENRPPATLTLIVNRVNVTSLPAPVVVMNFFFRVAPGIEGNLVWGSNRLIWPRCGKRSYVEDEWFNPGWISGPLRFPMDRKLQHEHKRLSSGIFKMKSFSRL